ncbi:MAG: hypothetical protein C4541_03040 [Candidatus Auribacter fodinae]|jgi:L-arabinokinase|uniref:Glycosyl transferase n=1 Tax=Candidatus Auribacter fodinae TaxID=2093366 RepID=A0A3A4R7M3_9BACT|nr:MAG: hypothetical protein C4541_03040 [Candidatus Auribacter fodinae]
MKKILFYVTGHGFGHATRMQELVRAIEKMAPETEIHIHTNAPEWFFSDPNSKRYVRYLDIDTGTTQLDCIKIDVMRSLHDYSDLICRRQSFLPQELSFIQRNEIDCIVADIPPAAFYIAHEAGIPAVGVANFTWDWIFEPYIAQYSEYKYVLDDMRQGYALAYSMLRLPFSGGFETAARCEDIPMIVRPPRMPVAEIRHKLGINHDQRPLILCSFGGFQAHGLDLQAVAETCGDYFFIGFGDDMIRFDNGMILPYRSEFDHPSLVDAADMVLSKLGYGTVAECVSLNKPLMYISRDDFREYPVLRDAVEYHLESYCINLRDFFEGKWHTHIGRLLDKAAKRVSYPDCGTNGADVAAAYILRLAD